MQDMAVRLSGYLSKLSLPSLGVTDILEIALISFFIYQFYPRLYSVEGNSDSTPFYFICICVENEYDPLDH